MPTSALINFPSAMPLPLLRDGKSNKPDLLISLPSIQHFHSRRWWKRTRAICARRRPSQNKPSLKITLPRPTKPSTSSAIQQSVNNSFEPLFFDSRKPEGRIFSMPDCYSYLREFFMQSLCSSEIPPRHHTLVRRQERRRSEDS